MKTTFSFLGVFSKGYNDKFVGAELREAMARHGRYEHFDADRTAPPPAEELARRAAAADVLLTGWGTPALPESITADPRRRLRYICHIAGQVSPFLTRRFLESDIVVTNWGAAGVGTFAEGTLALLLGCIKEMHRIMPFMREKGWGFAFSHPSPTLREKAVGLVGFGAIARALAEMLRPLGCRLPTFDPYLQSLPPGVTRCATIDELFEQSDIVSVHCGLTPQTTGMIGRAQLDRLRPHAIIVNTSRGKVIRQGELVEFLRARPDVVAGLDVYEEEPLKPTDPLLSLPNVLCYPHTVGSAGEYFDRLVCRIAAANIEAFCTGRPLENIITPEKFDRMT